MRQGILVPWPSPWSTNSVFMWRAEDDVLEKGETDISVPWSSSQPEAFIRCVSIGSGKLCKRGAARVSCIRNIHRAPSDHRITQVCWDFRGGILSILQTPPHQSVRAEIHPSAVPSHYCTERHRKGTLPLIIWGGGGEQDGAGVLLQATKRRTTWMAKRKNWRQVSVSPCLNLFSSWLVKIDTKMHCLLLLACSGSHE